jgi:hypothetical protein
MGRGPPVGMKTGLILGVIGTSFQTPRTRTVTGIASSICVLPVSSGRVPDTVHVTGRRQNSGLWSSRPIIYFPQTPQL